MDDGGDDETACHDAQHAYTFGTALRSTRNDMLLVVGLVVHQLVALSKKITSCITSMISRIS